MMSVELTDETPFVNDVLGQLMDARLEDDLDYLKRWSKAAVTRYESEKNRLMNLVRDQVEEVKRLNEYIDARQLIVNQFAFTDGKYWWKGEDLNEMKQKAEAFDAVKEWCLMFNQCIDSEAVKKKLYEILFPDEVDDLFKEAP